MLGALCTINGSTGLTFATLSLDKMMKNPVPLGRSTYIIRTGRFQIQSIYAKFQLSKQPGMWWLRNSSGFTHCGCRFTLWMAYFRQPHNERNVLIMDPKDTEFVNIRVSVLVLARGHSNTSQQVFGLVGQRMVELWNREQTIHWVGTWEEMQRHKHQRGWGLDGERCGCEEWHNQNAWHLKVVQLFTCSELRELICWEKLKEWLGEKRLTGHFLLI